ncbi:MAG TPA: SDR family NAD(P)-dependent oxidoreductase, partial [Ramlibacter sp.]|nr:SDR family NAD(P)-dependent oxidoreductase [Ramlibacter sp.]
FGQMLAAQGVEARRLHIDVAAHSRLLDGITGEFADGIRHIQARPGKARFLSSLSGQWLADDAPPDPAYWSRHLREPVRFADALRQLFADLPDAVLLEIGPGQGLGSMARQNGAGAKRAVLASTGKPGDPDGALPILLGSAGALWTRGVTLDWAAVRGPGRRLRVSLPTYAFDHERHWVEPGRLAAPQVQAAANEPAAQAVQAAQPVALERIASMDDWLRTARWVTTPAQATAPIGGRWLVVGGDALGTAFAQALTGQGAQVMRVVHGEGFEKLGERAWRVDPANPQDFERLCETLEAAQQLPTHIAHLGALETPAKAAMLAPQAGAFDSPVYLAKALQQLDLAAPVQWLQVTAGSQAVAGEQASAPLQALALGPVRVIPRELPMVRARLVDLDAQAPQSDSVDALLAEAQAPQTAGADDLVAWRQGQRWRHESAARSVTGVAPSSGRLRQGGVYLITGGLGGIALELASWLARTHQAKLALVSRRALPDASQWPAIAQAKDGGAESALIARLQALVDAGARIETFSADVTDRERMAQVVAECRARLGRIDGVFHAAGELDDAPLAVKSAQAMSRLLAVKAGGAALLHELLPPGTLGMFAVFSSTSVELGPPGQVDYVAANAAMEALAQSRPDGLAIRWGVWADIGMGARAYGREAPAGAVVHPLLGVRTPQADGVMFEAVFDPAVLWVLDEHRVAGRPVLPGTAYMEIVRAAMAQLRPGAAVEARGLAFEEAMSFGAGPRQVQTRLRAQGDQYECVVCSRGAGEARWQEHARATLRFHEGALLAAAPVSGPWQAGQAPQAACKALAFGARWNTLARMRLDRRSAVAQLELPEAFHGDLAEHGWHAALTDMALTVGLHLLDASLRAGRLYVPVSVDRIRIAGPLPARLTSHVELRGQPDGTTAVFDVTLHGVDGAALATIEGFAMRAIDPAVLGRRELGGARELSLAEAMVAGGIRAREAPALFERVFATDAFEVTASSLDVAQVRTRMDAPRAKAAARREPVAVAGQGGVSAHDGQGAAPGEAGGAALNPIEEAVAQVWRELLGVDEVQREDDFFALGGHSLIAVRLFARIRKQFGADLPLSTLFEAPTLATLAAAVAELAPQAASPAPSAAPNTRESRAGDAALAAAAAAPLLTIDSAQGQGFAPAPEATPVHRHAPAPSQAVAPSAAPAVRLVEAHASPALAQGAAPARRAWSPLVQICRGDAARKPLFCVHGAGGNVLNFKLIADRVGASQPFYGLQAQGVDGRLPPLTSVEAMASQYLEALRRVQPEGPYRLAGYSAGGLIALEMAQQLRAQGTAVEMLVMIDTLTPEAAKKRVPFLRKLWLMRHWTVAFALGWPSRRRRGRELETRYAQALEQLARGEQLPPELVDFHLFRNFMDAQSRYEPQPYPGSVALFKARESETQYLQAGPTLGWDRHVAGEIRITPIVGSHFSMMSEPGLSELAQALRQEIERLDAPPAPRPSGRGPGEPESGVTGVRGLSTVRGWLRMG